jgi:hypothetical protein
LRRELQFVVGLIQQVFGFLRVTLHVPFIGLLRVQDSLKGLPAQPLSGGQIRMSCPGDIPDGPLREGNASDHEQRSEKSGEKVVSGHRLDYKAQAGFLATVSALKVLADCAAAVREATLSGYADHKG